MVLVVRVYADALYVRFICHALLLRAGVAAAPSTAAQNHPVRERDAAREPHRRHAGNTSEKAHILKSLFDSGVIYRKCTRALTFQNALETPLNFKSPQRAVEKTLRCYPCPSTYQFIRVYAGRERTCFTHITSYAYRCMRARADVCIHTTYDLLVTHTRACMQIFSYIL